MTLFTLTKVAPGTRHSQPNTSIPPPLSPNSPPHAQAVAKPTLTQQMNPQQTLMELLRNVEGGVARLHVMQLSSSITEDDGKRNWSLELPVQSEGRIDLFQIQIKKDHQTKNRKKHDLWTITLAFDLIGLGPIQARVILAGGSVSTTFWAEHTRTAMLINNHLGTLHQRLKESGITIGTLSAHDGQQPQTTCKNNSFPDSLLDVQA